MSTKKQNSKKYISILNDRVIQIEDKFDDLKNLHKLLDAGQAFRHVEDHEYQTVFNLSKLLFERIDDLLEGFHETIGDYENE